MGAQPSSRGGATAAGPMSAEWNGSFWGASEGWVCKAILPGGTLRDALRMWWTLTPQERRKRPVLPLLKVPRRS